jgi:hypothetical protein
LGIRLPEVFLLGLLSLLVVLVIRFKQLVLVQCLPEITIAIALLTPLFFVILDRPALYNGVRHFTFVIPTLAIVAGVGLSKMIDFLAGYQKWRVCFVAVCVLLSMNTIFTLCALHPYQYLYYNHFAGENFKQAQRKWEADYWSSSLIEATKILEQHVDAEAIPKNNGLAYSVAVCAEAFQGQAYLDERFKITENWVTADFFMSSTNMNCDKVLQGEVIGIVERLGAPLAVVKDRRALIGEARRPRAAPRD